MADIEKYGLDLHCNLMLEDFLEKQPILEKVKDVAIGALRKAVAENNMYVTVLEARVKTLDSLAGKLELKGAKYADLSGLTDLVGCRVVTFYTDDVDKISAIADKLFDIDWENSVDKRKMHKLDSFGYSSLHMICKIPKSLYYDPACPQVNEVCFELQMRTALQHMWATMYHDTGYKSGVEIPQHYLRDLNRLAGMLELADEKFAQIRSSITDYRRQVQSLVSSGNFNDLLLGADTFRSYLQQIRPFDSLNKKIAAINQAEIHETTLMPYLDILKIFGFETIEDVRLFIRDNFDDAYQLSTFQLGNTDIDIISSTVAIQSLCQVWILKNGYGVPGLKMLFDELNGESDANTARAQRVYDTALLCSFMNVK